MAETLLTPSSIKLFGRLVTSLTFTNDTTQFGGNYFLQRQLAVNQSVDLTGTTYPGANSSTIDTIAFPGGGGFTDLIPGMTISEVGGAARAVQFSDL